MPERVLTGMVRAAGGDYGRLAKELATVGYPVRLGLLNALRDPKALHEIRVTPYRQDRGHNPARPVARQTIKAHLDRLLEAGLVRQMAPGESRPVYVADPGRLFSLAEDLRELSQRYGVTGTPDETAPHEPPDVPARGSGPRLLVVHGVYQGHAYPLPRRHGPWTVGRGKVEIALNYDPYVSSRNSEILADEDGFAIRDLPTSKNGTRVNWRSLRPGGSSPLVTGDLVGVGRSLLLFRQD